MQSEYQTCFSIQNKKEYIELHSKNPRSYNENLNKIQRIGNSAFALSEQVRKDNDFFPYQFEDVFDWQKKLETFIEIQESFPSIDNLSALHIINNLHDYYPMLHYTTTTQDLLDYWGYNHPDFSVELQFNGKLKMNAKRLKTILPIKPHNEFKIIRIFNSSEGFESFIDIKYRKLSKKQLIDTILTLPEFWRNFHLTTRKSKDKLSLNPTTQTNKILSQFYNPNKEYTFIPKPILQKKQILHHITTKNCLPIYANTFANHLIFRQPGLILPLTRNEQIYSGFHKPDFVIEIFKHFGKNYDTHSILTHVPQLMFKNTFDSFSSNFQKRMMMFTKFFEVSDYVGGQYFSNNESQIIFNYELNMIQLFESISKIDQI